MQVLRTGEGYRQIPNIQDGKRECLPQVLVNANKETQPTVWRNALVHYGYNE